VDMALLVRLGQRDSSFSGKSNPQEKRRFFIAERYGKKGLDQKTAGNMEHLTAPNLLYRLL